jgi:hypothetical protein
MTPTPSAPTAEMLNDMSLRVALDFADRPRTKTTMQAPADTMDELRRALRVLAAAYRAALARSEPPTEGKIQAVATQRQPIVPEGWRDVMAERQRQISAEGWTAEHDDEHKPGQLASAAACYVLNAATWLRRGHGVAREQYAGLSPINWTNWPWAEAWWKPTNERRDLVKAAALILAEIERIDRAATPVASDRDSLVPSPIEAQAGEPKPPRDGVVYVCPEKDIVCPDNRRRRCDDCPRPK